jgi:hypothetical protein
MSQDHTNRFRQREMVKVSTNLPPSDWHSHALENLWAEPLGNDRFRLQNVPFYAFGISLDDVVSAKSIGGQLIVQDVQERGGHSTYRVYLKDVTVDSEAFMRLWKPLEAIGATFEQANDRLLAVDVPDTADIYEAYALLQTGEEAGVWDFQEGHCGHPLNK